MTRTRTGSLAINSDQGCITGNEKIFPVKREKENFDGVIVDEVGDIYAASR